MRWIDDDDRGRGVLLPVGAAPALLGAYIVAVGTATWSASVALHGGRPVTALMVGVASLVVFAPEVVLVGARRRVLAAVTAHRATVRGLALVLLAWLGTTLTSGVFAVGFAVAAGVLGVEAAVIRRLLGARLERPSNRAVLVRGLTAAVVVVVLALGVLNSGRFAGLEWVVAGSAGGLASVVAFVIGERGSAWCLARAIDRQRQTLAQQRARDLCDLAGWLHDEVANPIRLLRLRLSDGATSIETLTDELDRLEHAVREGQLDRLLDAGVSRIGDLAQPALRRAERYGVVIAEMPAASISSTVVAGADGRLVGRLISGFVSNASNAGASAIRLRVVVADDAITVEVEDDAGGFVPTPGSSGRGLDDLARMVGEHNARASVDRPLNGGPSFILTVNGTITRAVIRRSTPANG